jgi:hypothetical protein
MRMRDVASKKILVEVALLKAIEARSAVSIDSLLKQLQSLRDGKPGDAPSLPAPAATASPRPTRAAAAAASPAPVPRAAATTPVAVHEQPAATSVPPPQGDLAELWTRLLEAVGRASPFTRTYLLEAHPVSFQKNLFTIGFDPEFEDHLGLVDNARNHALLQTKLGELGHANVQIKFIKADAPAPRAAAPTELAAPSAPAPATTPPRIASAPAQPAAAPAAPVKEKLATVPFSKDDFKNDPLIQKALEIFKGQIVEVRA